MNLYNLEKNVIKRGEIFYFSKMIKGKRIKRSLETGNKNLAIQKAKLILQEYLSGSEDILEKTRVRNTAISIGELVEIYKKIAAPRAMSAATMKSGPAAIKKIVAVVKNTETPELLPITVLTRELLNEYVSIQLQRDDTDAAKRGIGSRINHAKSFFSKWFMQDVGAHTNLPGCIKDFKSYTMPYKMPVKDYEVPPAGLIESTLKSGRALAKTDPQLYIVFVLAYDLGMRASEIAAAQTHWINKHGEYNMMQIINRENEGFKPKHGRNRTIPIHQTVMDEIEKYSPATGFFIERKSFDSRYSLITREFSTWMRLIGWDAKTYQHAAHELRALRGSNWYTQISPVVAQEWLGHKDISTTCKYYARLNVTKEPLPLAR